MVGGCVSNQPGDGSESSNTKSTEILTIKTRAYILTTGQPKRLSTRSSCQKSIMLLTPTNRPEWSERCGASLDSFIFFGRCRWEHYLSDWSDEFAGSESHTQSIYVQRASKATHRRSAHMSRRLESGEEQLGVFWVETKLTEQVKISACEGAGMCACVRCEGMGGPSTSSADCSCLLTSLPEDSWEQLQRWGDRGEFRSLDQTLNSLCHFYAFSFFLLSIPLKPRPSPQQTLGV